VPGDTAAATWALKAFALDSVDGKEAAFFACGAAMSTTMTIVETPPSRCVAMRTQIANEMAPDEPGSTRNGDSHDSSSRAGTTVSVKCRKIVMG
jgi:hypothetical protein